MTSRTSSPPPLTPRKPSLTSRISHALRSNKSSTKLRKQSQPSPSPPPLPLKSTVQALPSHLQRNPKEKPLASGAIYRPTTLGNVDEQTGERRDDTELLHGLAHYESDDSLDRVVLDPGIFRPPGENDIARLPATLWILISSYLDAASTASLALSSKMLHHRLGRQKALSPLKGHQALDQRLKFLLHLDSSLPLHLFCFLCGVYHLRLNPGTERLRQDDIPNPVYTCPRAWKNGLKPPPSARLTPGSSLPFPFIQLVMRSARFGPSYGLSPHSLERRYRDPSSLTFSPIASSDDEAPPPSSSAGWSHQTRYYIHKSHLLLRVASQSFALPSMPPSSLRHLLYTRTDYTPYFSCCPHWRDGLLMPIVKCALSHIPEPKLTLSQKLASGPKAQVFRAANPSAIVSLCSFCRPMRRCPNCPTEYLVELKLGEDRNERNPGARFKQIIVVTRWSDLGEGRTPWGREWSAVVGEWEGQSRPSVDRANEEQEEMLDQIDGEKKSESSKKDEDQDEDQRYDSFAEMGKRAISGIFEAQFGVTLPGQTLLSLNPKREKKGADGDDWY